MKKKAVTNIIIIALLCVAATCGYFFTRDVATVREEMSEYDGIQKRYAPITQDVPSIGESGEPINGSDDEQAIPPEWAGLPLVEADFEALLRANPDTVGWVAIPGTPVSYPVVKAADNAKYLNLSFNGKYSKAGTPFADSLNDMRTLDTNTIIYGHNMGAGRDDMFSSLLLYKDYGYFLENRYIQFGTIYQNHGWWEVFAVIEYDARSNGFQPLQIRFGGAGCFMEWLGKARGRSIHWGDVEITPQDKILTLSTCYRGNYGRYGRLLILAVNVSDVAAG
jgi:sortase B